MSAVFNGHTNRLAMSSQLSITNLIDGEVLSFPLAIIRGEITADKQFVHISKSPTSANPHPVKTPYPVRNKQFTATIQLETGANSVTISTTSSQTPRPFQTVSINLCYIPPPSGRPFVRLVYVLPSDQDPSFQTPDPTPCDVTAAIQRIQTAGMMIQAGCAEMMQAHGFGRRTFQLSSQVHAVRMRNLTLAEALTKDGMQLWQHIEEELRTLPHRHNTIDLVIMSFTRMVHHQVRAHTALGGGPLALFGGGSLFTWPQSVSEIPTRFADSRKFDTSRYFDDSAGRAAVMGRRACTSTTIGALLHELGHCLSLPHPTGDANRDGGGIMSRGFDHFDRLFVQPQPGDILPFWDRGSAARLRFHRYLQFAAETAMHDIYQRRSPIPSPTPLPTSQHSNTSAPYFSKFAEETVICESPVGIGHIGYYKNGDNAAHDEFAEAYPHHYTVPSLSDLQRRCHASRSDKITLSAIDLNGRITTKDYSEL